MVEIEITDNVPMKTKVLNPRTITLIHRDITDLLESIELINTQEGSELLLFGDDGRYDIYPVNCTIVGYGFRRHNKSGGIQIPVRYTETKIEGGIQLEKESMVTTRINIFYNTPEHIQRLRDDGKI
ncbi:MAG: hypothetical protein Q8O89_01535 [Nanoarchaeota archaeon]|nr:hypothetical protein [Nanoarchaeota archaeon]